jgi:hypothetical protein
MPFTAMVCIKGEAEMIEGNTKEDEKKQLIKTFNYKD